jgi:hypothetical protein
MKVNSARYVPVSPPASGQTTQRLVEEEEEEKE